MGYSLGRAKCRHGNGVRDEPSWQAREGAPFCRTPRPTRRDDAGPAGKGQGGGLFGRDPGPEGWPGTSATPRQKLERCRPADGQRQPGWGARDPPGRRAGRWRAGPLGACAEVAILRGQDAAASSPWTALARTDPGTAKPSRPATAEARWRSVEGRWAAICGPWLGHPAPRRQPAGVRATDRAPALPAPASRDGGPLFPGHAICHPPRESQPARGAGYSGRSPGQQGR